MSLYRIKSIQPQLNIFSSKFLTGHLGKWMKFAHKSQKRAIATVFSVKFGRFSLNVCNV